MTEKIQVVLESLKAYNSGELELFKSYYEDSYTSVMHLPTKY